MLIMIFLDAKFQVQPVDFFSKKLSALVFLFYLFIYFNLFNFGIKTKVILTLQARISQTGQTHLTNSSANCLILIAL